MKSIHTRAVPLGIHMRTMFFGALISFALATILSWAPAAHAQSGMSRTPIPGVTVEIVELKRIDGKAVGLVYVVKNETNKKLGLGQLGVNALLGAGTAARLVALVDFKNGKRYGVGLAGDKCLCSAAGLSVPAGGAKQFWAQFAAPPATVDNIAVMIGSVPPFYNVPIQK